MIGPTAIGSTFLFPAQIALDSTGNLDIAIDTVVLQLPNGGTTLTTLAGTMNDFGYSGDNGPATSALLSVPGGLAFSPLGALLVADWTRVRSISAGDITTVAGDGKFNFYGDGGPATQAGLSQPKDTAFDGAGNLYIADVGNNTVRKVDAVTGAITTVWGTPVYDPNFPLQTEVPLLYDIAADDAIHLFLSTSQGIQLLDVTTGETTLVAGSFAGGGQLSFDGQHMLAVESFFDVLTFDTNTQQTMQIIPPFEQVAGLALDGKGNVYFSFDCSVWEENISTKAVTEIAGGQGVDNCSPSAGGNLATNNALYSPGFLHLDGAGHLLIAEADRVDSVDLAAGTITTIGGSEVLGFSGDGGVANAAQINRANSLNVDASGNYYIADSANDRIRKVAAQPLALLTSVLTDTVTSSAVTLTATYTGALAGLPPTGSVTFLDGTTSIGTSTLTASSTAGSYVATLTDSTLAAGTHSITAQYPGDANYAPVTTAAVILTVTAPIPPSYTVAANPSSLSIAQGSAGTTVLTVTPAGGFNQTVSFSCGTGLPTGVSCSFSQASVTPTGTAAVSTTLTIQTTGTSTAMLKPQIPETRWWLPTGATSLACLLMLGVPKFRRRGIWLALLFAILAAGANGCGSGGSSGGGGGGTNPNATPPGTYAIKLATTAGSGSSAESQPLTLSVTVTQ
jgi:sugar lactone lactonase YvrE